MNWFVAAFVACVLVPSAHCASDQVAWCYHETSCNDATWPTIAAKYCNGTRQSPINIVSSSAEPDDSLTAFTFQNYGSTTALKKIENTGKTVKVTLDSGVQVSGGGLSEPYDSLQFHLHWGNGSSVPGSEHTVDGKQYPMELHIVNSKSSLNGNTTLAVADSTGLAALGFFIEEMSGNSIDEPASWRTLTSYLANITNGGKEMFYPFSCREFDPVFLSTMLAAVTSEIPFLPSGENVSIQPGISLDDLLTGVDRTSYYRYLGSLTTPNCNEAVVWTVFKDSIKVSKNLIDLFSTTLHISNSSSPLMTNVFRRVQSAQPVTTQRANSTSSSASTTCYSVGLLTLSLLLGRN